MLVLMLMLTCKLVFIGQVTILVVKLGKCVQILNFGCIMGIFCVQIQTML